MKEANLVIDNLTSNSPALLTLLTDPGTATTAVTSIVTLDVALQKAVDAIAGTWKKIQDIDQGHRGKKLEMEFALLAPQNSRMTHKVAHSYVYEFEGGCSSCQTSVMF